jgi:hypothetical protein
MGVSLANIDLGSLVNGASSLVNSIGNQIRGKIPIDMVELAKLELQMEQLVNAKMEILAKVDEAQTLINLEDSKSSSWFKSAWRPAAAWMCIAGLFNNTILMPTIVWFIQFFSDKVVPPLTFATDILLTLLFGLLGLTAARSYDKKQLAK